MREENSGEVDLRVYQQSGHVGPRKNYLAALPPGPLLLDERQVPWVCVSFWRQELTIALADVFGCALLTICIGYIGWSRLRAWERLGGPIKGGIGSHQFV